MLMRTGDRASDRTRSALILLSSFMALGMIVVFHWMIESGILFTHFFYVPIILSAIWWRRKGLALTGALVACLIASDALRGDLNGLSEDLLRGAVMCVIAMVTFLLNERALGKEVELAEMNRQLEDRVAERTAQLRRSNEELKGEIDLRKGTEALLDRERRRLEIILRSIVDGVVVADGKGAVTMMNPGAESMTGYAFKEAEGRPLQEIAPLFNELTGEPVVCGEGASGRPEEAQMTVLVKRSGGRTKVAVSCAPIIMEGESVGRVAVLTDITERERLKEDLWQGQHYHSIELLSGGVAHDFGNFLMSLNGNLELLKTSVQDQKGQDRIAAVQKASDNAHGLTRQLMAFSRVGTPSKDGSDIRDALVEIARFNLAGSDIALETDIDQGLSEVIMDKTHLSQVVGNVVINAKQAMGGKGTVRITARNVHILDSDRLRDGDYVRIDIADDGPGMPPEVLRDVFEPYFTKKKEGAGLGMAITKYSVMKHGGLIEASSRPGGGTTFTLHIPAACCRLPPGGTGSAISL